MNGFETADHRLVALVEATRALSASLDVDQVLRAIVEKAAAISGAPTVRLFMLDEAAKVLRCRVAVGFPAEIAQTMEIPVGVSLSGLVAQTGVPVAISDTRLDPRTHFPAHTDQYGVVSYLGLPVSAHACLFGVLVFNTPSPRTYGPEEIALLNAFAQQAAVAIQNARLYEGAQRELAERRQAEEVLRQRTRQLDAVRAVSEEVARELDLPRVLELITRRAVELVGANSGILRLWDEEHQLLVTEAWTGEPSQVPTVSLRLGEGISGEAARRREGLYVNEFRASPYAIPALLEGSIHTAVMAVPLLYRERLVGALAITRNATDPPFTDAELQILTLFAPETTLAIENARLHAAAVRRSQELEALLVATRSVMSGLDLQEILDHILDEAGKMAGASHVRVELVEREARALRVARVMGDLVATGYAYPPEGSLSGLVVARGEPVFSEDVDADPRTFFGPRYRALGIRTFLGIPIKSGGTVLGVLTFNTTAPRRYAAEELAYLTSFADQAAVALENARLFQQEQVRREELEAAQIVTEEITRELDLTVLLRLIHERAVQLVHGDIGVLYLWSEETQRLVPKNWHGYGDWVADVRLRLEEGVSGTVAARRQGLIVNEFRTSRYATPFWLGRSRQVAALSEPLLYRDQLVGVITISREDPHRPFTPQDQSLLRLFANQAAIAIENAQLHDAAVSRSRELEAVRTIGTEIIRELDLPTALNLIARHAVALVNATSCGIRLWNPERQMLVLEASTGSDRHGFSVPLRLSEGVAGTAAVQRKGLIVNDFRRSAYTTPALLEGTAHTAVMAIPLLYGERLVGVIAISREQADPPFTEKDLEVLGLFAPQAAIAIENARLFHEQQRAYVQLQAAQEELVRAEKLRALGQMAAGVAHDLNNMLAAILGQAELLRLRVKLPEIQDALQVLYTAATDGAQVVRRLQEFGRQQTSARLEPCELAPIVQEALELTRPRWQDETQRQGRHIRVSTALDSLPPVLGHPAEIREALTNLILNAADAMPHGGTLTLAGFLDDAPPGAKAPAGVCLTVTDTGIGMPEEVRHRVFDPFYTTKGLRGTGLGLAVVYGIMERHGGRVDVASEPGQGTTFTLRFQAATSGPSSAAHAGPPLRRHASRRILLVDDEDPVRTTIATLLREVGHDVLEAESGAAGLAGLEAQSVDLVITDLGMPEMTGWEVAERVKTEHPRLPVILLTGWGQQISSMPSGQACVDRVLAKPIRLEELQAAIAGLTAASGSLFPDA